MPIDPVRRIAKWDAKYDTATIKTTLDKMRPTMLQNVAAVFPMIASMELQVKQVLDGAGVDTTDYPGYLAFGREVWALTRKDISASRWPRRWRY